MGGDYLCEVVVSGTAWRPGIRTQTFHWIFLLYYFALSVVIWIQIFAPPLVNAWIAAIAIAIAGALVTFLIIADAWMFASTNAIPQQGAYASEESAPAYFSGLVHAREMSETTIVAVLAYVVPSGVQFGFLIAAPDPCCVWSGLATPPYAAATVVSALFYVLAVYAGVRAVNVDVVPLLQVQQLVIKNK